MHCPGIAAGAQFPMRSASTVASPASCPEVDSFMLCFFIQARQPTVAPRAEFPITLKSARKPQSFKSFLTTPSSCHFTSPLHFPRRSGTFSGVPTSSFTRCSNFSGVPTSSSVESPTPSSPTFCFFFGGGEASSISNISMLRTVSATYARAPYEYEKQAV